MITKYNTYIKESIENKRYLFIVDVINQLNIDFDRQKYNIRIRNFSDAIEIYVKEKSPLDFIIMSIIDVDNKFKIRRDDDWYSVFIDYDELKEKIIIAHITQYIFRAIPIILSRSITENESKELHFSKSLNEILIAIENNEFFLKTFTKLIIHKELPSYLLKQYDYLINANNLI